MYLRKYGIKPYLLSGGALSLSDCLCNFVTCQGGIADDGLPEALLLRRGEPV